MTLEILHHLREIYRRRLFAMRGFSSLFDYATRELGYSAAAAQRRISAMHLLAELPEMEDKIKSGDLSLTHVAQAQKLFNTEKKLNHPIAPAEKKAILESLTLKSTREAEQILLTHSSQPVQAQKPDHICAITPTESEMRLIADQELLDKLERVKGLIAHTHPNPTLCDLFKAMADIAIEKLEPKRPQHKANPPAPLGPIEPQAKPLPAVPAKANPISGAGVDQLTKRAQPAETLNSVSMRSKTTASRFIPTAIRREVYHRDQGRCQYRDPQSGRICHSQYKLQLDHTHPFALGGAHTTQNLQLLCAAHNRTRALQTYGEKKMARYLRTAS
jgi:5-methylcytosine-specific restriction endonuclease McrA